MPMKNYVSAKIVKAEPMDECTFLRDFKGEASSNRETRPGYHVIYPDGYDSWSPKEAFDNSHREITPGELTLITG